MTVLNYNTTRQLEEIYRRYNPEFDVPPQGAPFVTWAEYALMGAVKELAAELETVRAELKALKAEGRRLGG